MFELRPYGRRKNNALYNPFHDFDELERRFFDGMPEFFTNGTLDEFKTDIKDEGDYYELKADLPGFDKKDIHLDIDSDVLRLSAQRHSEHEEKDKRNKFIRCERSYGSYTREFDVSNIKTDEIKAKYENGVLTLTMPKKENTLPPKKHLEIE